MKAPKDCHSMQELRSAIDVLDAQIVAALARRATYIDRAIALKPAEGMPARVDDRIEDVVAKVRGHAEAQGLDADLVDAIWRRVIEWSIDREEKVLGPDGP